ncbi:MAG: rRNA pseudouridine synthase [Treponema sp.]|jgi:23S rRNA pseudouridine2605 synthase|nr:rRNA pseudouridine synthase [Treponema sp.]
MEIAAAIRLQKFLAQCGVASRRAAEQLILDGRVTVNEQQVQQLGTKISPCDRVCVDGVTVQREKKFHYILLNKPPGYVCTSVDPQQRPCAIELVQKNIHERLYSVGRLDFLSSGAIIFTNDGDFALNVAHPRSNIEKEYIVETSRPVPDPVIESFAQGILVEDIRYKAIQIKKINPTTVDIVLIEGKNREIRRVLSFFHMHPVRLHRVRIGPVRLASLKEAASRPLSPLEKKQLMHL